jgi:flagellar hook-length control protein FliK
LTAAADALKLSGATKNAGDDLISPKSDTASAAAPVADPTSTLAMLQPAREAADTQSAAVTRTTTQIDSPVGSPGFTEEAAQRVTWMAKNGIDHAEIRVTPPDMGPIHVSIDMKQNEASVNFVVTQTDTRVAVEDSLHRLEEMFAESGIALSQASVGQQDAGQSFSGNQTGNGNSGSSGSSGRSGNTIGSNGGSADIAVAGARSGSTSGIGLINTFA